MRFASRRMPIRASAPPSAASDRPTRTRSAAAPSASWISPICLRWVQKIERLLAHHNALRRGNGLDEIDAKAIYDDLAALAPKILPYMDTVWSLLDAKRREGKRILFEGAQGALLDIDHGTYPFVTSSNTVAAQAATGSGVGPGAIDFVLGICKAYTTRVGEGPFPTDQMDNAVGKKLGERGHEFGTVTGRARRCGWFDAVLVRQTVRASRHQRAGADQARHSRRLRRDQGLRRLSTRRPRDRLSARRRAGAGARRAGLRDHRRLERADRQGALMGGISGAGDQICAPRRGTGRLPRGAAVDQPGARGHHPDEKSIRKLNAKICQDCLELRLNRVGGTHDRETAWPRARCGESAGIRIMIMRQDE